MVPYTDEILVTASRFELLKVNRLSGRKILSKRSPLDSTNLIVTPLPTHRPEIDPHNPNKKPDPKTNQRVTKITSAPLFLMTSSTSGLTTIVDWTTLNTIDYFSLRDQNLRVPDKGSKYMIRSMIYFGGNPKANFYIILGSNIFRELQFFSTTSRNIFGRVELPQPSYNGQVAWVNHTSYVYIEQTNLALEESYKFSSYFLNLGDFSQRTAVFLEQTFTSRNKIYYHPTLLAFDYDLENNEVYDEDWDRLDYFYLMMSTSGNSIQIEAPVFAWDFCNEPKIQENRVGAMYYGRFRHCWSAKEMNKETTTCHIGFQHRKRYPPQRTTDIHCEKRRCQNPCQKDAYWFQRKRPSGVQLPSTLSAKGTRKGAGE